MYKWSLQKHDGVNTVIKGVYCVWWAFYQHRKYENVKPQQTSFLTVNNVWQGYHYIMEWDLGCGWHKILQCLLHSTKTRVYVHIWGKSMSKKYNLIHNCPWQIADFIPYLSVAKISLPQWRLQQQAWVTYMDDMVVCQVVILQ